MTMALQRAERRGVLAALLSRVLPSALLLGLLVACSAAQPPQPRASAGSTAADTRLSGWHYMSRSTQALQDDDAQNPAFLWVRDGQQRFERDCVGCHRDTGTKLREVATRYPAFDNASGRLQNLSQKIRQCHSQRVTSAASVVTEDSVLALESYLAWQARGVPIRAKNDPRLAPALEQGRRLWQQRLGQLDLSCSDCHDRLAGRRLAGSTIPQPHPTGYPIYRLEWQGLGSLQRRLRGCMTGVRAEPFSTDAPEWLALELYLKARAAGMAMDGPAVRP